MNFFESDDLSAAPEYTILVRNDNSAVILDDRQPRRAGRCRRGLVVKVRGRTPWEAIRRAKNVV